MIIRQGLNHCSGIAIDDERVLTAGHCVDNNEPVRIQIFPNTTKEFTVGVATTLVHQYDDVADISLLHTDQSLSFSDALPIACPPERGSLAVIMGYPEGADRGLPQLPRATPEYADTVVVGGRYDAATIVKLEFDPRVGVTAKGSSGGPIFAIDEDGTFALVAVYNGSFSMPRSGKSVEYDVGTTVAPFLLASGLCVASTERVAPSRRYDQNLWIG